MILRVEIAGLAVQVVLPTLLEGDLAPVLLSTLGEFVLRDCDGSGDVCASIIAQVPGDVAALGIPLVDREDLRLWADSTQRELRVVVGTKQLWVGAIERSLRFAVATWLPRSDGLLLHAAATVGSSGVVAFAGTSGSGKSTVAKQFEAGAVLGDDTIALRRESGRWWAYSTPFVNFSGKVPSRQRAPMWRLYALEQARKDGTEVLSPIEQLTTVTRNVVAGLPGGQPGQLLDLASSLAHQVEIRRLLRTRDATIAPFLNHSTPYDATVSLDRG